MNLSMIFPQLDLTDKWFHMDEFTRTAHLSTETEMCTEMYAVAQRLINHFVKMQGLAISQVSRALFTSSRCPVHFAAYVVIFI